jgi:hypothetical protein
MPLIQTSHNGLIEPKVVLASFDEYYANESTNYWQWIGGLYNSTSGGFCGSSGGSWCSPYNFRYQNTCQNGYTYPHQYCPSGVAGGRWKPNSNPTVKVTAFIPSTHATNLEAHYEVYYNGGVSVDYRLVNQSIYYNSWAWIATSSTTYNNISKVELWNEKSEGCCSVKEVAWDEIHVFTP